MAGTEFLSGQHEQTGMNQMSPPIKPQVEEPELPKVYTPTREELDLVKNVSNKFDSGRKERLLYEKTWLMNNNMIRGQHYTNVIDENGILKIIKEAPSHRQRMVVNKAFMYYRRTVAKLSAGTPQMRVYPASNAKDDKERSEVSDMIIRHVWNKLHVRDLRRQMIEFKISMGSALYHWYWDSGAGDPLRNEFGEVVANKGEIGLEIVNPFEIIQDPSAKTVKDARWLIWTKKRSIDWLRSKFPNGKYLRGASQYKDNEDLYEESMANVVGVLGRTGQAGGHQNIISESAASESEHMIKVHEYWERPSEKHKTGRLVIIAGDILLHSGENPYEGELPFIKSDEVELPGRFWGMSVIEQLIPQFKNLNSARSKQIEDAEGARPKIMVPRGSKIAKMAFVGESWEIVEYTPDQNGTAPFILQPASLSQPLANEVAQTEKEIDEISGFHEISRGVPRTGDLSGRAVALLQDSDDTQLGMTMHGQESADEELGRAILWMASKFWTEERTIKVVGDDNEVLVKRVTGQAIKGRDMDADYFDVRVKEGSGFLKTREEIWQEIERAAQVGLIDPLADKQKMNDMLDFGLTDPINESEKKEKMYARSENDMIIAGRQIVPKNYEDHATHVLEHNEMRNSAEWRKAIEEEQLMRQDDPAMQFNPSLEELMEAHIYIHVDYLTPRPEELPPPDENGNQQQPQSGQ